MVKLTQHTCRGLNPPLPRLCSSECCFFAWLKSPVELEGFKLMPLDPWKGQQSKPQFLPKGLWHQRHLRTPSPRGFIKFLCRKSVGFFSWAFLVFLMKESKKRRWKQPDKLMAKSRSQPVNLPSARPLMNPLLSCVSIDCAKTLGTPGKTPISLQHWTGVICYTAWTVPFIFVYHIILRPS